MRRKSKPLSIATDGWMIIRASSEPGRGAKADKVRMMLYAQAE